ncbi:MAG: hypothetical protein M1813_007474 [Trichoglossum hirsutum]|nr:MAG: hypothetical protein M1813_007474 [Trichoglossum hirsutum]
MRGTPSNSVLHLAADEVAMLNRLFPSLELKPVQPPKRKKDILEHLITCMIFHFDSCGKSDPLEPSRSSLLLEDWKDNPLTVRDLREHRLQENSPFLGNLSVCSTGTNEADKLADEAIHLITRVLYETLQHEGMTDRAVCRGLHRATRWLRDETSSAVSRSIKQDIIPPNAVEAGAIDAQDTNGK